jgi:hypothetical protein
VSSTNEISVAIAWVVAPEMAKGNALLWKIDVPVKVPFAPQSSVTATLFALCGSATAVAGTAAAARTVAQTASVRDIDGTSGQMSFTA